MLLIYSLVAGCLEGALRDVESGSTGGSVDWLSRCAVFRWVAPAEWLAFVPRKARSGHRPCPERRFQGSQRPESAFHDRPTVPNAPFRATTPRQEPSRGGC